MRIALCSSSVPFVKGGYRNIVDWLAASLREAGHTVEVLYLPENDDVDLLFSQMAAFRAIDLSMADVAICFRPQSYYIRHPRKVVWFIHHIRALYDLWGTDHAGMEPNARMLGYRDAIRQADTAALGEAEKLFANSEVTAGRLREFNGLESRVLYPPVYRPERFRFIEQNDEIVCICRIENHKRQHLLIEGLAHTESAVRLRLCGRSMDDDYVHRLHRMVAERDLGERVTIDHRWIAEEEKEDILSRCLAAAYVPLDEDSYGYPTLEAGHSAKPILTVTDAGGVLEFVQHGLSGLVASPEPAEVGAAMDRLFNARRESRRMGEGASQRIGELRISWSSTIVALLA